MALATRSARAGNGDSGSSVRAARQGVFRKEGEYWTVGHGGKSFRLRDTRGLSYLAHLLRHPAVEFHVLDLFGGIASQREEEETSQSVKGLPWRAEDLEKAGIHTTGLGDAGEMVAVSSANAVDLTNSINPATAKTLFLMTFSPVFGLFDSRPLH